MSGSKLREKLHSFPIKQPGGHLVILLCLTAFFRFFLLQMMNVGPDEIRLLVFVQED